MKLAWKFCNQTSPYHIDMDFTLSTINQSKHIRASASNHKSSIIQYFLWPALFQNGECLSKAVVVTWRWKRNIKLIKITNIANCRAFLLNREAPWFLNEYLWTEAAIVSLIASPSPSQLTCANGAVTITFTTLERFFSSFRSYLRRCKELFH